MCAGSIAAFSLYGPLLLSRLGYTQYQVNAVSVTAEVSQYLPVPLVGYLCDRYSRRLLSLAAAVFFGVGYLLAALTYRRGPHQDGGWPYGVMMVAFLGVGVGTCCMIMASVTTCAKNFARSEHKGLALAVPLAAFGLSGMWLSQVGSRLLSEKNPNGRSGEVDVYRFFLFLAGLLFCVGLVGAMALQVVAEDELIDEAAEQLERSGFLEDTVTFQRAGRPEENTSIAYGAISIRSSQSSMHSGRSRSLQNSRFPASDGLKKTIVLNAETRRFVTDRKMWLLAWGFFLILGPGEAFIYNLGTIIDALYPAAAQSAPAFNSAATNVSVVAISSTLARLVTGILSDLFAPQPSPTTLDVKNGPRRPQLSRMALLITSGLLLSCGQLLLASSIVQQYPQLFPLVSALNGIGYGAVFSLTPIIIGVVWGVQNFGTNWGIIAITPAVGGTVWGAMYSAIYEHGVRDGDARLCHGVGCYAATFWGMTICSWIAVGLWFRAWRAWVREGIFI